MMAGNKNGFTLIEMMLAQTLLAIALLTSINTVITVTRYGAMVRRKTEACNLCETTMEMLKSIGYDGVANNNESNLDQNGHSGGRFDRTITVTDGTVSNTKFVTVTVSWTWR